MALIEIGSQKQLFLDDYLIESMTQAKQGVNPAVKVANNPIIRSERPWEGNHVMLSSVVFDDAEGLFKLWYTARNLQADPEMRPGGATGIAIGGEDDPPVMCLATSEDGIHWERPVLGLVEYAGSKENNIVPPGVVRSAIVSGSARARSSETVQGPEVDDGHHQADAVQPLLLTRRVCVDTPRGQSSHRHYAGRRPLGADFLHGLGPHPGRPTPPTWRTATICGRSSGKRLIGRAESPDLIHWTEPETVLVPDTDDFPDTEFYRLVVIPTPRGCTSAYSGFSVPPTSRTIRS